MLAFAETENVEFETDYFKDQCIIWALEKSESKYKDILVMLREDKVEAKVVKRKYERVVTFEEELSGLCQLAKETMLKVSTQLDQVKGKSGRKEEEEFWTRQERTATDVCTMLEVKLTALTSLKDLYMQEFGQNMQQKKVVRSRQQNQAHLKRRKAKMQGQKKKDRKSSSQDLRKVFHQVPRVAPSNSCKDWKFEMCSRHTFWYLK